MFRFSQYALYEITFYLILPTLCTTLRRKKKTPEEHRVQYCFILPVSCFVTLFHFRTREFLFSLSSSAVLSFSVVKSYQQPKLNANYMIIKCSSLCLCLHANIFICVNMCILLLQQQQLRETCHYICLVRVVLSSGFRNKWRKQVENMRRLLLDDKNCGY